MTPAQAAKAIDKVLASDSRKSDKARALFELGLEKTEVAELVPMNYSQAHSVWKGMYGDTGARVRPKVQVPGVRQDGARDPDSRSDRRSLFLTPAQVRYITQDGHEVVRVDKRTGAECYNCGQPVAFVLSYLGFVHKWSKSEPTDMEDRYAD